MRCLKGLKDRVFHRPREPQSAQSQLSQNGLHADRTPVDPKPVPASQSSIALSQLEDTPPKDLWKAAFDQLNQEEQNILQPSNGPASTNGQENVLRTTDVIDKVLESTKQEYEEYQKRGGMKIKRSKGEDIDLRQLSWKIINAALVFKEIIGVGAACDPTGHAASAWTIVSLGLTVSHEKYKNIINGTSKLMCGLI
jgi:hypothetical protein